MAKILVLVQNAGLASNLEEAVKSSGMIPVVVNQPERFLASFQQETPGLVILDLEVNQGAGLLFCHQLREAPGGELVPILLLGTGREGVRNFGDALAEGGDYYFDKPVDGLKIVSKIRTYVGVDTNPFGENLLQKNKNTPLDLSSRVAQMMDLGQVFNEGLLSPTPRQPSIETEMAMEVVNHASDPALPAANAPGSALTRPRWDSLHGAPPAHALVTDKASGAIQQEEQSALAMAFPQNDSSLEVHLVPTRPFLDSLPLPDGQELDEAIQSIQNDSVALCHSLESTEDADSMIQQAQEAALRQIENKASQEQRVRARRESDERKRREAQDRARREIQDGAQGQLEEQLRNTQEASSPPVSKIAQAPDHPPPDPAIERPTPKPATAAGQAVEDEGNPKPRPSSSRSGLLLQQRLEEEARAAREEASKQPLPEQSNPIPTVPDLPPHPGQEMEPVQALPEPTAQDVADAPDPPRPRRLEAEPWTGQHTQTSTSARQRQKRDAVVATQTDPGVSRTPRSDKESSEVDFAPAEASEFHAPVPEQTDLHAEALPRLLWRCHLQEVTGLTLFRQGSTVKEIYWERGTPTGFRSTSPPDQLEELLLRDGLIDRAGYADVQASGMESARSIAAFLVQKGFLDPDELFPLVRRYLEEGIISLFEWAEGTCSYIPESPQDQEKIRLSSPLPALILEGIRRKFNLERLIATLGSPATLLAPTRGNQRSAKAPDFSTLGVLREEKEVLRFVDGLRPVEEIVFMSGQSPETVYRVLLGATATGLLTIKSTGEAPGEPQGKEAPPRSLEIKRRRIEAKFQQVNNASYFEILGVSVESNPYEIEAAFQRLSREFHPNHFNHPQLDDISGKLEVIQKSLEEARDILTDDHLREGYRNSLSDKR